MRIINEYDHNPVGFNPSFVNQNSSRASIWWAESILETYSNWSADNMRSQNECPGGTCRGEIRKAYLTFSPRQGSSVTDMLSPYFLSLEWWTIVRRNDSSYGVYYDGKDPSHYAFNYEEQKRFPDTWWGPTEKLAKSMWATVLVDLGVNNKSNILLDPKKLRNFTADFVNAHEHSVDVKRGPETEPYDPSSTRYGPLGTSPAVISAVYICSVPRRKSVGTLAWSIILADLVFLQALWVIFQLIVDAFLEHKVPEAAYCVGCRELLEQRERENGEKSLPVEILRALTAWETSEKSRVASR